ncbi:MAG: hypothetical protein JWQ71_3381 [Pedosphaera sp.]|nr:hypothetical protein [Pedosphaera sp.]
MVERRESKVESQQKLKLEVGGQNSEWWKLIAAVRGTGVSSCEDDDEAEDENDQINTFMVLSSEKES